MYIIARIWAIVNINIFTHLKSTRIKKLVSSGMDFTTANEQAQRELLDAFGLSSHIKKDVSSISMTDGTDEAAALIATSSLILMDRSDAELAEYIAALSSEFGGLGYFYNRTQFKYDVYYLARDLSTIKDNLINKYQSLNKTVSINDLFRFIDWNSDGIVGNEVLKEGESVVAPSVVEIPAEGGYLTVQITSPIRIYLEAQVAVYEKNDGSSGEIVVVPGIGGGGSSRARSSRGIQYECSIDEYDNTLRINAAALGSSEPQTEKLELYDYVGNVVATIKLMQLPN